MSRPNLDKFVANAAAYKAGEWGDGSIMEAIKQIIEMMMPFMMQCFAMSAKAEFLETVQNPSGVQKLRLRARALLQARKLSGFSVGDRPEIARSAAQAMVDTAAAMNDDELCACHEEMKPAA